jgi:putative glutamine amidotransferase
MAPVIGITTYGKNAENRFTLPVGYVEAVRAAGGIPLLIPPGEPRFAECLELIDGLILAGGGDIDPALYGGVGHPQVLNVDTHRDRLELELAREVIASSLPTLGICRGLQVLNVAQGGTLIEHLPDAVGETVVHRTPSREPVPHPVRIKEGSRLAAIMERTEHEPFSLHHQAIRDLGNALEVVARAPDGTIEAVEMPGHPWLLAVQWHPELTAASEPADRKLFDAFVAAALESRTNRKRHRQE